VPNAPCSSEQPAASSSTTQQPTTSTHNLSFLYCALRSRLHQLHSSLAFLQLLFASSSFSTMIIFVDIRTDWSSVRAPPTPCQLFIDEMFFIVSNCMLFNSFVYLTLVLFLQLYRRLVCCWLYRSWSAPRAKYTSNNASFVGVVHDLRRDLIATRMDYGLLLIITYCGLTTFLDICGILQVCRYHYRYFMYHRFHKRREISTSTRATTTTTTMTTTTTTPMRVHVHSSNRFKSSPKFRVLRVVKRSHPLYWKIPVTCCADMEAACRVVAPGRTFKNSRRRTLPTITEETTNKFITRKLVILPKSESFFHHVIIATIRLRM